jgi:hypothetical protein
MKFVLWVGIASVASAAIAGAATQMRFANEIWLGMAGPLLVASGTWVLVERVYKERPERLTPLMITTFAGKLVFFGAYVGLAIGLLHVRPIPFIVSFTAYYIALHMIEALCMKRLFVS